MPLATTFNPTGPLVRSGQGSALANREDLDGELQLLAPEDTPFLALCGKGKAISTYSEFNIDMLKAPVSTGVPEGQDIVNFSDKFEKRARLGSFTQVFQGSYSISNVQEAVTTSTGHDLAKSEEKMARELKRNIEASICSDNEMQNGNDGNYQSRGAGAWLSSTAQAFNPVPADYRTPVGSILTSLPTETSLNDMIASIFSKTGKVDTMTMITAITQRKNIANMQRTDNNVGEGVYNVTQVAGEAKMVLKVQLFESDFGIINLVNGNPDCMPNLNRAYCINPKYWAFKTLKPTEITTLPNLAGGPRAFIETMGGLQCLHPQASGKIAY